MHDKVITIQSNRDILITNQGGIIAQLHSKAER